MFILKWTYCGEGQFSCIVTFASITPCSNPPILPTPCERKIIVNHINQTECAKRFHSPPPLVSGRGTRGQFGGSRKRGAGFRNTRAEPRDLVMYVSRCRQRKVCHVRESGTSYLSELVFVSLFVRQSSTKLQAVQTAQHITQENIASKYYSFQLIICHKVQLF